MQDAQWSDVMTLMAIMVAVDGKVFKEEVDAFIVELCSLHSLINKNITFSKKNAYDWYVTNRTKIRKMRDAADAQDKIIKHIIALNKNPNTREILASMRKIAIADDNLHPSEHRTLSLAAKTWQLDFPSKKA